MGDVAPSPVGHLPKLLRPLKYDWEWFGKILYGIFYFLCSRIITEFSALLNCPWIAYLQGHSPQIKMHFSPQKQGNALHAGWTESLKVRKAMRTRKMVWDDLMGLHGLCFWQLTQQMKSVELHIHLDGWMLMLHGRHCLHTIRIQGYAS